MARTNSTQTYVKETSVVDLVVEPIYTSLMQASVDKDSIYIRAKDTMEAFFKSSTMTATAKAEILSGMLVQMTSSLTTSALNAAVQIAKENRDGIYNLTKLREDTLLVQEQRDKLAADNLLTGAAVTTEEYDGNLKVIQGWKVQSDMIRENGVLSTNMPTITTIVLPATSIGEQGLKWEQEQQTKMSVYATLAKSYRESGVITWTTDGGTGKVVSITDASPTTPGLTRAQEKVAIRQEIGFDDNKVQHAANSSANMIGLLLSAEESGNITVADVNKWRTAVDYLNTPT